MTGYISPLAAVGSSCLIAPSAIIYGRSIVGDNVVIGPGCIVGFPKPTTQSRWTDQGYIDYSAAMDSVAGDGANIGDGAILRSNVVIYAGATLGERCDVAHNVTIREDSSIGLECYLMNGLQIMASVTVGVQSRLAGTICNRARLGPYTSSLGHLMHRYTSGVAGLVEEAPVLGAGVIVGRESSVIGGVTIGDFAIVGAGAVIARNVPESEIWIGNPGFKSGMRHPDEVSAVRIRITG